MQDYTYFMEKPDVIFHLAALPRIQPSLKNPKLFLKNNIDSTINILEYAKSTGATVIFSSSSSTTGNMYANPYTTSKAIGEQLCRMYYTLYDVNAVSVRFYNVYGDHMVGDTEFGTVLGIWLDRYEQGLPLTITGDGAQRRDYTHVDDIVDWLFTAVDNDELCSMYSPVELGRGENHSLNELASLFPDATFKFVSRPKGEMADTLSDGEFNGYGWKPHRNVKDFIKEKIEEIENGHGAK